MTDESAAVVPSHPPEAVMRVMNSVLRHLLRTPVGKALKDFMVLGVTGRKSGRRYSIPVSAHVIDGRVEHCLRLDIRTDQGVDTLIKG